MGAHGISKEIRAFQAAVQKLSGGVSQASALWRDSKYSELSSSVGEIATQSRDVMVSGERCCSTVSKFEKIADEDY